MGKQKLLTTVLSVVILILCVAIYYTQRQVNVMRIAYNRADRENAMLKDDYNKLYNAYYLYNEKLAVILRQSENVSWSNDSNAYAVKGQGSFYIGFINKPTMKSVQYLWEPKVSYSPSANIDSIVVYIKHSRIDTLKPHQFLNIKSGSLSDRLLIAPATSAPEKPLLDSITTEILIKKNK